MKPLLQFLSKLFYRLLEITPFHPANVKNSLWRDLSKITDIALINDLHAETLTSRDQFYSSKERFERRVNNLITILGIILPLLLALTFYIFDKREIHICKTLIGFTISLGTLLITFVFLIIGSRMRTKYTEIKLEILNRFALNNDFANYLKLKIFTLQYSSLFNQFELEKDKRIFKYTNFLIAISFLCSILFGSYLIISLPDKSYPYKKEMSQIATSLKSIETELANINPAKKPGPNKPANECSPKRIDNLPNKINNKDSSAISSKQGEVNERRSSKP